MINNASIKATIYKKHSDIILLTGLEYF